MSSTTGPQPSNGNQSLQLDNVFATPICKMTYEQCEVALERTLAFGKQWGFNSVDNYEGDTVVGDAHKIINRMAELRPVNT